LPPGQANLATLSKFLHRWPLEIHSPEAFEAAYRALVKASLDVCASCNSNGPTPSVIATLLDKQGLGERLKRLSKVQESLIKGLGPEK
jgi:hypothetical protein